MCAKNSFWIIVKFIVVFEEGKRKTDRDKLVITEIPYTMVGANIGKFIDFGFENICAFLGDFLKLFYPIF